LGSAGEVVTSECESNGSVKNLAVGSVEIDGSIRETIARVFAEIAHTELSAEVRAGIEKAWHGGQLFGNAFAVNLSEILSKYGLIFLDPMNARLKALASPIYVDAVNKSAEIVANIRHRSSELEDEGFHAQVVVEE